MILPDVNVLVYAYRREAEHHERYASWLRRLLGGAEEIALVDATLAGFVRIVTNPRILADPAPTADALDFVAVLRAAPRSRWLPAGDPPWEALGDFAADDRQLRGNLVPDAWLAALATTHHCRLASSDRGFARFPGLDWFDPAADGHRPAARSPRRRR